MSFHRKIALALVPLAFSASSSAAIMHGFAAVSVPADSPWALVGLGALVAVVVARALRKR